MQFELAFQSMVFARAQDLDSAAQQGIVASVVADEHGEQ